MADATIGSLPALSELDDNSLLVAEQGGSAHKLSGAQIKAFAVAAAESEAAKAAQSAADAAAAQTAAEAAQANADFSANSAIEAQSAAGNSANDAASARDAILNMIVSAITLNTGEPATVQKSVVDEVFKLTFGLPRGEKGEVGSPGRGITSITLKSGTHAAGTTDTYTITFTDNTTYDFQVTNGANGFSPTITTSKSGKVTTVTVVDAHGTQSFEINDGADGLGSGDMHTSTYDPKGKAQDIFAYVDAAVEGVTIQTDATPMQGSTNPVQSGGVYTELGKKLAKTGDGSNVTAAFKAAASRANIATGEKLSVLFGKIAKWFADLGSLAFKSKVTKADLAADVPLLPGVTAADNGKFLRVVNGAWAASVVDSANGVSF